MNVLVTGATGFIGSHLVEALVNKGYQVYGLFRDNKKSDFLRRLGAKPIYGDLLNKETLKNALKNIDVVYHLAAALHANTKSKKTFFDVNVLGTKNLIEACLESKVKKFVHCSSVGVHGITKKLANENSPCKPTTDYDKSKYLAEKLVRNYLNNDKMDITIVRPAAIVYGPRDFSAMYGLFQAIESKKFMIIGNGRNIIHMIYVKNLVNGMILAAENKRANGQTYILADETLTTVRDIQNIIAKTLKVPKNNFRIPVWIAILLALNFEILSKIIKFSPPLTFSRVSFLTSNRAYDISKAKRELGFKSWISLQKGIQETVDWYIKNGHLRSH